MEPEEDRVTITWDSRQEYKEFIQDIIRSRAQVTFPKKIKQDIESFKDGEWIKTSDDLLDCLRTCSPYVHYTSNGKLDKRNVTEFKKLSHIDSEIVKQAFSELNYNKNRDRAIKLKLAALLVYRGVTFSNLSKFVLNNILGIPNWTQFLNLNLDNLAFVEKTLKSKSPAYAIQKYIIENITDNMLMLVLGINDRSDIKTLIEKRLEDIGKKEKKKKKQK